MSLNETASYDAPANNKRAVEGMGNEQLALFSVDKNSIIARELIQIVQECAHRLDGQRECKDPDRGEADFAQVWL